MQKCDSYRDATIGEVLVISAVTPLLMEVTDVQMNTVTWWRTLGQVDILVIELLSKVRPSDRGQLACSHGNTVIEDK